LDDANPAFLAFRYSDGTWTVMVVSEDGISEIQEMTAAKLIEIIKTLETIDESREKDWWNVLH